MADQPAAVPMAPVANAAAGAPAPVPPTPSETWTFADRTLRAKASPGDYVSLLTDMNNYNKPKVLTALHAEFKQPHTEWLRWAPRGDPKTVNVADLRKYLMEEWVRAFAATPAAPAGVWPGGQPTNNDQAPGGEHAGEGTGQNRDAPRDPNVPEANPNNPGAMGGPALRVDAARPPNEGGATGGGGTNPPNEAEQTLRELVVSITKLSSRITSLENLGGPIELDNDTAPLPNALQRTLFGGGPAGGGGPAATGRQSLATIPLTGGKVKALLIKDHLPKSLFEQSLDDEVLSLVDGTFKVAPKKSQGQFTIPGFYSASAEILDKHLLDILDPSEQTEFARIYNIYVRKVGALFDTFTEVTVRALDNWVRLEQFAGRLHFNSNLSEPYAQILIRKSNPIGDSGERQKTESTKGGSGGARSKRTRDDGASKLSKGPCRYFNKSQGCNREACPYEHACSVCHKGSHGASACRDAPKRPKKET
jgi:hypothetical protein